MSTHHWINLAFIAALLSTRCAFGAETFTLASRRKANDLSLVEVTMTVGGTVKLAGQGKPRELPMSVEAKLAYEEKLTNVASSPKTASRSFRYYRQAEAAIKIDKGGQKPVLGEAYRLIGAQTQDGVNT